MSPLARPSLRSGCSPCGLVFRLALEGAALLLASRADGADFFRVLVFSRTEAFRHESIPAGISLIESLGTAHCFAVEATENPDIFTPDNLARYQVVVFLNTTGDVLDGPQETAMDFFMHAGGGFVGVHSAADTEYGWGFYGECIGAYFADHPATQQATIVVENNTHPSTQHLGTTWVRTDEWYNFQNNPRPVSNVLLRLDESTYTGGTMGDHPIAWTRDIAGGGRAFYTGLGHTTETYAEPAFRAHLLGGILWAAGRTSNPPCGNGCDPDVNRDGASDQDDVAMLINVIAGAPDPVGIDPDFDRDGNADQSDVASLINVVAGGSCP